MGVETASQSQRWWRSYEFCFRLVVSYLWQSTLERIKCGLRLDSQTLDAQWELTFGLRLSWFWYKTLELLKKPVATDRDRSGTAHPISHCSEIKTFESKGHWRYFNWLFQYPNYMFCRLWLLKIIAITTVAIRICVSTMILKSFTSVAVGSITLKQGSVNCRRFLSDLSVAPIISRFW